MPKLNNSNETFLSNLNIKRMDAQLKMTSFRTSACPNCFTVERKRQELQMKNHVRYTSQVMFFQSVSCVKSLLQQLEITCLQLPIKTRWAVQCQKTINHRLNLSRPNPKIERNEKSEKSPRRLWLAKKRHLKGCFMEFCFGIKLSNLQFFRKQFQ